jgi:hypothetical protein
MPPRLHHAQILLLSVLMPRWLRYRLQPLLS